MQETSCWAAYWPTTAQLKRRSRRCDRRRVPRLDDYVEIGFPVYSRGAVVATARGRIMEESTNAMIQFGGVQVRPGDVVMADRSGVVIIPQEHFDAVLAKAQTLFEKEESMVRDLRSGMTSLEVDQKYGYEKMLK
jgi:regulator of RNase E activity RraA